MEEVTQVSQETFTTEQLGEKLFTEICNPAKVYHKKVTYDSKGYITKNEYYKYYTGSPASYAGLAYVENISTVNNALGIPVTRTTSYEFYIDDVLQSGTRVVLQYYAPDEGIRLNRKAFSYVFDYASMYLISQVGLVDAKAVLNAMSAESSLYTAGSRQPLLDAIANSTNTLLTPTIKATLNAILNVTY